MALPGFAPFVFVCERCVSQAASVEIQIAGRSAVARIDPTPRTSGPLDVRIVGGRLIARKADPKTPVRFRFHDCKREANYD